MFFGLVASGEQIKIFSLHFEGQGDLIILKEGS